MTIKILPGSYDHTELPHQDYLADREHVANHWLKHLVVDNHSPRRMWYELNKIHSQSEALIRGDVIHTAILEPDLLHPESRLSKYLVMDADVEVMRKNTNIYKRHLSEMQVLARDQGKKLVTNEIMEVGLAVRDSVFRSPFAKKIFNNSIVEQSLIYCDYQDDDDNAITSKVRMDCIYNDQIVIDVKSSDDCSPQSFWRSCKKFGYDVQASHQQTGASQEWQIDQYGWFVVEPKPPYEMAFYQATPQILQRGAALRDKGMSILSQVYDSKKKCWPQLLEDWPTYPDKFTPLEIPAYDERDGDLT